MKPTGWNVTTAKFNCVLPRVAGTRRIVWLVLTCLLTCRGRAYAQSIDTRAIYAKASDAVVLVLADQITGEPNEAHQGTGVIVSEDGRILSALHVIKGAGRVTVKLKNGDIYDDVRVTAFDERRDLVVLKVAGFGLRKVALGNSDTVKVGESVAFISNPEGLEQSISQGIISGVRTLGDRGYKVLQTTAPASHGSSGGAILNAKGELVAIANSKLEGGENLNFAIPINYARGMLPGAESLTVAELSARLGGSAAERAAESRALAPPPNPEDRWWGKYFLSSQPTAAQKGASDAVIAKFREQIRLNPQDDRAHVVLGMALELRRDWDGASAEFREATGLNPNNGRAHSSLGRVLLQKGDMDGAIAESRQAILLDPENDTAHLSLGQALENKGDLEAAIAEYRPALRSNQVSGELADAWELKVRIYLGYALRQKGDLDGAIAELRRAVRLLPSDDGLHRLLGAVLEAKGDRQGALEEYGVACTLNPNDSDNKEAYERLLQEGRTPHS